MRDLEKDVFSLQNWNESKHITNVAEKEKERK